MYTFVIPGPPVGKGRPKFSTRGGFYRAYTPAKTMEYESLVKKQCIKAMMGREPIDGPVQMRAVFYFPIPKSTSKKTKAAMEHGTVRPTIKSDIDNLIKSVLDGINGVGFYDDKQVVEIWASKRYGVDPHVLISFDGLEVENCYDEL